MERAVCALCPVPITPVSGLLHLPPKHTPVSPICLQADWDNPYTSMPEGKYFPQGKVPCPLTPFNLNTPSRASQDSPSSMPPRASCAPGLNSPPCSAHCTPPSLEVSWDGGLKEISQPPPAPVRLLGTPCPHHHCVPQVFEELLLDTMLLHATWLWLPQVLPCLLTHQQNNRPGHSSKNLVKWGGAP